MAWKSKKSSKQKFYVVWAGRKPGIYRTWAECKAQVDGFSGARYKSFESRIAASRAFVRKDGTEPDEPETPSKKKGWAGRMESLESKAAPDGFGGDKPRPDSISVDAACSGNPGRMEYQAVHTGTGELIFREGPFPMGTNNIGEFLALVHALIHLKKTGDDRPIYSDSIIAMLWVRNGKAATKLKDTPRSHKLLEVLAEAEEWLKENTFTTKIYKWNTKEWGEIPADFGRK